MSTSSCCPKSDLPPDIDPKRSALMARVKGKNTAPELIVRRLVHAGGFRFRLHRRDLPGSPDLVFPRYRAVIFVHGCFWHRHEGCSRTTTPKTRTAFWNNKFEANVARDARVAAELEQQGWRVLVLWECETKNPGHLADRVNVFLTADAGKPPLTPSETPPPSCSPASRSAPPTPAPAPQPAPPHPPAAGSPTRGSAPSGSRRS